MEWKIAQAKQQFSELMQAALSEPQPIYKRNQLMAFLVEAELFQEFLEWRKQTQLKSIADTFDEIRAIAAEEDFVLETPSRQERNNPFLEDE
ncbi:MAG: prevent-host-death protein [Cyanobacteria bacterium P01_D01_bin.105]